MTNPKSEIRIPKLLGWGSLVLLAVMPFHAFLSVWAGHLFGHMAIFQSWKEVLLALMAIAAGWLIIKEPKRLKSLTGPLGKLIAAYAAVSILVTVAFARGSWSAVLRGAKTDLGFLLAFVLAALVGDKYFKRLGQKILLGASALVGVFAIAENTFLPANFLTKFGYSKATIPPFLPYGKLMRFPSTLGGPNQLGAFLILPIALTLKQLLRQRKLWQFALLAVELSALFLTDSRSAWLGTLAAGLIVLSIELPKRWRLRLVITVIAVVLAALWQFSRTGSSLVFRQAGKNGGPDSQHLSAVKKGVDISLHHPLGIGLGSAGPASFESSSPIITENYYLQIAIETGIVGLILFLGVCAFLAYQLWLWRGQPGLGGPLLASLVGVSVVNLFLHGWADSSTALTYWTLAGLTFGAAEKKIV